MRVKLQRLLDTGKQTIGRLIVYDDAKQPIYSCDTLELPWRWNEKNKSCIPPGEYVVYKWYSPKFNRQVLRFAYVPNRDGIEIHSGNFYTDIKGCILVGEDLKDINNDGQLDVTNSNRTLDDLLAILPQRFILDIRGC